MTDVKRDMVPVETGIDWLTCTRAGKGDSNDLWKAGLAHVIALQSKHRDVSDWRWLGYEGVTVPGLAVGRRDDGAIVRASGDVACKYWKNFVPFATNVSRIDMQVTVTCDPPQMNLARQGYISGPKYFQSQGRPPAYSLLVSTLGTSTLYIGSRNAAHFARLYDKGLESRTADQGEKWRYEIEVKGDSARARAVEAVSQVDEAAWLSALVWDHFSNRGVPPIFTRGVAHVRDASPRAPADVMALLEWLGRGVRPTVQRLREGGYLAEALRALDLAGGLCDNEPDSASS